MTKLTNAQKQYLCITLAKHLPRLREILNLTQKEFGDLCGISVPRISVIENGHFVMTWTQFTSMMLIFYNNLATKEYLLVNGIVTKQLVQYVQLKDDNIPPTLNVDASEDVINVFRKLQK